MDDLPIVPAPLDTSILSDISEAPDDVGDTDNEEVSLNFGEPNFDFLVPPPPPDPMMYETDDESGSEVDSQGFLYSNDTDVDEGEDGFPENSDFMNYVDNLLDSVHSGRSSQNSDHVSEPGDIILPPPPMSDNTAEPEESLLPPSSTIDNDDDDDDDDDADYDVSSCTSISSESSENIDASNGLTNSQDGVSKNLDSESSLPPDRLAEKTLLVDTLNENKNFDSENSLPTYKLAGKTLLVDTLNEVLKKQISDKASAQMSVNTFNDENTKDPDNLENTQEAPPVDPPTLDLSLPEQNIDESKTAENLTDSVNQIYENLSALLTPVDNDICDDQQGSSPENTTKKEEEQNDCNPNETKNFLSSSSTHHSESMNHAEVKEDYDPPPTNNPVLASKLNNVLKKQLTDSTAICYPRKFNPTEKLSSKEQILSGPSTPAVDDPGFNISGRTTPAVDDSGFSTARSEDGSHSGRKNSRAPKTEELMFNALPATDAGSRPSSTSPQLSQLSRTRTFSASSEESSTFSDDNESAPKLNLRHMLLKHMKNRRTDSEGDDDEDASIDFEEDTNLRMRDFDQDINCAYDSETRLNEVDVSDWRVQDVCEWLELIGFSYLRPAFSRQQVNGKVLTDHQVNILDSIKFDNPEDREIIQSEIKALQMANDEEMEMAILDALDKANFTNNDNSHDNDYATIDETLSSFRGNQSLEVADNYEVVGRPGADLKEPDPNKSNIDPSNVNSSETSHRNSLNLDDLKKRLGNDIYDPSEDGSDQKVNDVPEHNEQVKVKKKTKKKGFFSSFRKKKSKKEQTTPISIQDVAPSIVQSNPKGMVSIVYAPPNGGNELKIELLISSNTTSREVAKLCLDHLELDEDVKCYHIVAVSKSDKKVPSAELNPADFPLLLQQKWNNDGDNRFELRKKVDGVITVQKENYQEDELITYQLEISFETTAIDVIPILLKIFDEKDDARHFWLGEGDNEARLPDNTLLLGLPMNGEQRKVFRLINKSPRYLKQRQLSYNNTKRYEDKILSLEQEIENLAGLNDDYRRNEEHLAKENDKLSAEVKKQESEVTQKTNELKALQEQIISLNQKLRLSATVGDGNLKDENEKMKQKISELQHSVKAVEQNAKMSKDSKTVLEKEYEETTNKCKKLEVLTEDLTDQLQLLREERRNATSGNTEQMNKLYNENKEYLKSIRILEEKLSETEQKLAEMEIGQEVESSEEKELRRRVESLDSAVLAKDNRILELEFRMQQKDRDLEDTAEQLHDQCRKTRAEVEMKENAVKRCEEAVNKVEGLKSQLAEKDKQVQSIKAHYGKLEKKLSKQKHAFENEKTQKLVEIQELEKLHQEEVNMMIQKIQNAETLLSESERTLKQLTLDSNKEREELAQQKSDLEKKISAKDGLIERLEGKIAKSDTNVTAKLQEQGQMLLVKDEKLHKAEVEIAKLESEHASKLREMANTIRMKEGLVTKLEARFKKLETSSADNVKKFEKYVSEKDKLLQQITLDHDQTFKNLKSRTRELEEMITEKENKLRDAEKHYGEATAAIDVRLRKREKEYKRQKYLLEKVLKLVNDKAPSLLRQLHDSLDESQSEDTHKTHKTQRTQKASASASRKSARNDDWC